MTMLGCMLAIMKWYVVPVSVSSMLVLTLLVGSAIAEAPRTGVTILSTRTTGASHAHLTRPARRRPVPPLSAPVLESDKRQVATAFNRSVVTTPVGLTGPLTLGISSWGATVGSVTGSLFIKGVDATGFGEPLFLIAPPHTTATGTIDLQYTGLTAGGLYMLDCSSPDINVFSVDITAAGSTQTWPSVTFNGEHAVVGFQAPGSEINISLYNEMPLFVQGDGSQATEIEVDACTLHPVG